METIIDFVTSQDLWVYLIAAGVLAAILGVVIWLSIARAQFRSRLRQAAADPDTAGKAFRTRYPSKHLLTRSRVIERVAKKSPQAIAVSDICALWIRQLESVPSKRTMQRVLRHDPDNGLFIAFLGVLRRKSLARVLLEWLEQSGDLHVLRRIALSGRGQDFSGADALELFRDRIDEIREMAGDPEWAPRYFAVKIMLHDGSEHSERGLWEAFADPHALVRRTLAREFRPYGDEKVPRLAAELHRLLTGDPVFEVRAEARRRIAADYPQHYSVDLEALEDDQALHVLEQLDPESSHDKNLALRYLDGDNLELRLPAAQFLSETGDLHELFTSVDFDDRENLDRSLRLLRKAAEVDVVAFLKGVRSTHNPASLYLAAALLRERGDRALLDSLMERASRLEAVVAGAAETYDETIRSVAERGTERALRTLERELDHRRSDPQKSARILDLLPERGDTVFAPLLLELLQDTEFEAREELLQALLRLSPRSLLPRIFEILKSGRERYPHRVRIDALKLLIELKLDYCLEFILENLSVFPLSEAREYARRLAEYSGERFTERVNKILQATDGQTRAALIASLPATENRDFLPAIRQAVSDADPQVRTAGIWALVEYGDTRSLNQALDRLRDPVADVRSQAARALGHHGSKPTLDHFAELLADENEVQVVKLAALEGLGASEQPTAVAILVQRLGEEEDVNPAVVSALADAPTRQKLRLITEQMKDAEATLRDQLTLVFRRMGEQGEQAAVGLLHEDISSLKPHLTQILEDSGYVESTIRKLSHRDPTLRREAAEILSLIGSTAAFRGIVAAARDPDQEVRVQVTKALEALDTDSGNEILQALESDPDKRVRKYTLWALERVRAKRL